MRIIDGEIEARVYTKTDKGVYFVKVNFPKLGMWINNITVKPSPNYPDSGLWVQMPSNFSSKNKRNYPSIQFRGDSVIKPLIEDEVLRAVDRFNIENQFPGADLDRIDEEVAKAFDELDNKKPP